MEAMKDKRLDNKVVNNSSLGKVTAFNRNAVGYDNNSSIQYIQARRIITECIPQVYELIKTSKLNQLTILDAGCGNGLTTVSFYIELRKELVKVNPNIEITITGIDVSQSMIQQSINNMDIEGMSSKNFNFYSKNIEEVAEEDGEYDIIFSNAALHWCTPKIYRRLFDRLKNERLLIVSQGGEDCYKELHDIVWSAIKECNLDKYFKDWEIPLFYPSKEQMFNLLEEIGYKDILINSEEHYDINYKSLIDAFANASLLLYLEKLPDKFLKDELKEKYYELCNKSKSKDVIVHRLNIIAKKCN